MTLLAAQKCGLSVLELEEAPFFWRERALIAISAENWAEKEYQARQRLAARTKGRQ